MTIRSATYPDERAARRAVDALVGAGIPRSRISFQTHGDPDDPGTPIATVTGAHRGALISAAIGAVLAAAVAALIALGLVPSQGFEFVGQDPFLGALKGAVVGGATGALFGFILGMGMWDTDGEVPPVSPHAQVLVTVEAPTMAEKARAVLLETGGQVVD